MNMKAETLGAHLRNLLTPYKNLLQLVKDGKADEETIRKYNLDNLDELIAFSNSETMEQEPASEDLEKAARKYAGIPEDSPHDLKYCVQDKKAKYDAVLFGANLAKKQMKEKAVDVTITIPYQNGYGGYSQIVDSKEALPFGEKVKVIVIKED
jgi:hypothetical protein